jgi:putative protein kinase ArgK-like GTPase of G3E family
MNPDYGARLQLQKIVMLDVADIVVVNKTDLERAKAALLEINQRLTQNRRNQQIVATVAKRHRDPGVDALFELITKGGRDAALRRPRTAQRAVPTILFVNDRTPNSSVTIGFSLAALSPRL